jgi:ABC-2 type transport system permease protein
MRMFWAHLTGELWKLFGKKRTYIGFGAFLLAQNLMLLLFRFSHWRQHMERMLQGNGYLAQDYVSALSVAVILLTPQVILLLPLYASLVGGDLVAKEAEDGTLRMVLSRPISRFQLLLVKWVAGMIFAMVLVAVLGATALGVARLWFPWKGMFVMAPGLFSILPAGEGFKCYLWAQLFMGLNAGVILGIAFMFSCCNMKPAAATILSLSILFVTFVMQHIPFFEQYQEWLLTYHFQAWLSLFAQPMDLNRVFASLQVLLAVAATSFLIGAAIFQTRDIKS